MAQSSLSAQQGEQVNDYTKKWIENLAGIMKLLQILLVIINMHLHLLTE
jgi:hypothetical protein